MALLERAIEVRVSPPRQHARRLPRTPVEVANVYYSGEVRRVARRGLNDSFVAGGRTGPQSRARGAHPNDRHACARLDAPFDRTLASPRGSPERAKVEALVQSLQIQADL